MRVLLATFVLVCGLADRAEAVSLRDLVDLSKQGISDDILIALVEAERAVFHLGAADVTSLKGQGLSDRLVIYLLQTPSLRPAPEVTLHVVGQRAEPRESTQRPRGEAPQVVVIERVETVAVPVYVPVVVHRARRDEDRGRDRDRPVYWGYGGTLRPDSWEPAPVRGRKDKR